MPKEHLLNQLFDAHVKDLNDVRPDLGDVFICPICLTIFPKEAIAQKLLTDGHVWPREIRKVSKKAATMRGLLCKKCNNTAGSYGDRQMQLNENVKKGEKTGELYGNRKVQLLKNPGEEPIDLHVKVTRHLEDNSFTVTGRIDKNLNWLDDSLEDQARFRGVLEKGDPVKIVIHPNKDLKYEMVRSGWITSAYLMAFYSLGYRYILNPRLNPVRTYINQSFDKDAANQQVHPDEENFTIKEYISQYFNDPELLFIIPLENDKLVYLQVNCFEYEIRLPFWCVRSLLNGLIRSIFPDLDTQHPNMLNSGKHLYLRIICAKTSAHECLYDILMGKSIPETTPEKVNN